jgi:DnaJ-domain-containing protein 1
MSEPSDYKPKFGFDIRIKPAAPRAKKEAAARRCAMAGCKAPGEFRVPKHPTNLDDRHWLCQNHVRDHNAKWNFFAGMSDADIENFRLQAALGHRPTWPLGRRAAGHVQDAPTGGAFHIEDGFAILDEKDGPAPPRPSRLTKAQRDALNALNLEEGASLQQIRAKYKELVKRFHPDANGGDRGSEERLRQVIKAYSHLRATGLV